MNWKEVLYSQFNPSLRMRVWRAEEVVMLRWICCLNLVINPLYCRVILKQYLANNKNRLEKTVLMPTTNSLLMTLSMNYINNIEILLINCEYIIKDFMYTYNTSLMY